MEKFFRILGVLFILVSIASLFLDKDTFDKVFGFIVGVWMGLYLLGAANKLKEIRRGKK